MPQLKDNNVSWDTTEGELNTITVDVPPGVKKFKIDDSELLIMVEALMSHLYLTACGISVGDDGCEVEIK